MPSISNHITLVASALLVTGVAWLAVGTTSPDAPQREHGPSAQQPTAPALTAPQSSASLDRTQVADPMRQWPHFRGPLATGEAPHATPPLEWSSSRNVRWKTALPGRGHSSPVVWQGSVFVTTAIATGPRLEPRYSGAPGAHDNLPVTHRHRYVALAISLASGEVLWQRTLAEALPREGAHNSASLASPSPVTDGEHVYAFFGSEGLFALTPDGETVWERDLGDMQTLHGHGEGSSPALHGETLVVNWDHEGDSFLFALDKRSGEVLWKAPRDEPTSWSSPVVTLVDGIPQAIVSATQRIRGYDLSDGTVLWECGGLSRNVVASPVVHEGLLIAGSSYDTRAMLAIRLHGAKGDITGSEQVVWSRDKRTPYVPSPLVYGEHVYFLRHYQGILTQLNANSGVEPHSPTRLDGLFGIYASPVAANGRIYVTDRSGNTAVLSAQTPPRQLAFNRLGEGVNASLALVGDKLLIRGEEHLFCLAEE